MRTFTLVTALLLLAGCQRSPKPPAPAPAQAPPTPAPDQTPDRAAKKEEPKKAEPRKPQFPLDQEQFKTAVMGKTREELNAKYGPPDETGDWGAAVGWDGPVSIYHGPFTTADGKQARKARVYFRKKGMVSAAASVDFTNQ